MINIILADDHQILLDGIASFLENDKNVQVVGTAANGKEALALLNNSDLNIDVAVLDIDMPEMDGIEATRHILQQHPNVKILMLTMYEKGEFVLNLMRLGAHGYLLKDRSKEALVGAIHAVHGGARYYPPAVIDLVPKTYSKPKPEVKLTKREKEVLCWIADPSTPTYEEIGEHMDIALFTVQTHVQKIKKKLELKRKEQLILYAIEKGICVDSDT